MDMVMLKNSFSSPGVVIIKNINQLIRIPNNKLINFLNSFLAKK